MWNVLCLGGRFHVSRNPTIGFVMACAAQRRCYGGLSSKGWMMQTCSKVGWHGYVFVCWRGKGFMTCKVLWKRSDLIVVRPGQLRMHAGMFPLISLIYFNIIYNTNRLRPISFSSDLVWQGWPTRRGPLAERRQFCYPKMFPSVVPFLFAPCVFSSWLSGD